MKDLERACFLLDLDAPRATAFLRGVHRPAEPAALVSSGRAVTPQTLGSLRAAPNRVPCRAWSRLVGDRAERIMAARPYYGFEELATVSGLPLPTLRSLFAFDAWRFHDRPRGAEVALTPVDGQYVVEASDFEAAPEGHVWRPAAPGSRLRVITPLDFEGTPRREGLEALKRAYRGQLMPVVTDEQGRVRVLVPGLVVVGFEPGADSVAALAAAGVQRLGTYGGGRMVLARVLRTADPAEPLGAVLGAVSLLNAQPGVRFAEPEQIGSGDWELPIDIPPSEFESVTRRWNHDAIRLAEAHARTRGRDSVTVFIVDSGLDVHHPQLAAALRPGWNDVDLSFDLGEPESASSPMGLVAHGTQVAGVVAGQGTGSDPVLGVAPGCRIVPAKVPGTEGGIGSPGWGLRAAAILSVLDMLREDERAVMNLSWRTSALSIAIREALADAAARDVVIVMSAGNYPPGGLQQPDEVHYPSCHADERPASVGNSDRLRQLARCSISVGALGPGDRKASYSYFGRHSVGVFAPGGEIGGEGSGVFTTSLGGAAGFTAGTSFACPHVAGVAALLRSADPGLAAPRIVTLLKESARSLDAANPQLAGQLGRGGLDAAAALARVPPPAETVPDDPPDEPPPDLVDDPSDDARLDINTATEDGFQQLPLVGAYRARTFVAYREAHGPYASVFDLMDTGVIDAWAVGVLREFCRV